MKYFKLPDLGEGLPEAEIVEWHIREGDAVKTDQLLVSVETAKAIVDVPSPCDGVIAHLFGKAGDIIHTGEPLVEFEGEADDTGTVVGELKATGHAPLHDDFIIGAATPRGGQPKATPAVRALAKRLEVDLTTVSGTGRDGLITADDVENAARLTQEKGAAESLRGVRRTMAKNMARAQAEVALVTVVDDVDIGDWLPHTDITMRLVRAIREACREEPALNAWYEGNTMTRRLMEKIDLGIAVDTPDGLFVPVLRDVGNRPLEDLRQGLDLMRADVRARTIPPSELVGATITLSNFGTIAGKYATTIVVPPMVAILGAGKIRQQVVAHYGHPAVRPIMPLSLSFDHRCITGGEAARWLKAAMDDLAKES